MELRTLSAADIPSVLELSTGAGWNQTAADWLALMNDTPDGCIGIECDRRIIASTTVVCYGTRLAWIGMVLTHPDYQRRGLARRLLGRAIEFAQEREIRTIKLDATEQGRPLYESFGFRPEQQVQRWGRGTAEAETQDKTGVAQVPPLAEPGGYLLHRPGVRAYYLGPCLADSPSIAERLFRRALHDIAAPRYFWDLLPGNGDAVQLAGKLEFAPLRTLTRMVLGDCPPEDESRVFAIAGFEWG